MNSAPEDNNIAPVIFDDARLGYTQEEAAKICGVSRQTIWRDTKLGKVHRTSRGIYPRAELERYLRDDLVLDEFRAEKAKAKTKAASAGEEWSPKTIQRGGRPKLA